MNIHLRSHKVLKKMQSCVAYMGSFVDGRTLKLICQIGCDCFPFDFVLEFEYHETKLSLFYICQ